MALRQIGAKPSTTNIVDSSVTDDYNDTMSLIILCGHMANACKHDGIKTISKTKNNK